MPRMNGWEFVAEYKNFIENNINPAIIIMLSTSENPDDKEKALETGLITDFKNKPLTADAINDIIEKHIK